MLILLSEIERSKYIYDLDDNWDDEGSIGYTFETWEKAINFITKLYNHIKSKHSIIMDTPTVSHGPMGSIDILWENSNYRLLINVPKDSNTIKYYGDNYKNKSYKGTHSLKKLNFISNILFNLITT